MTAITILHSPAVSAVGSRIRAAAVRLLTSLVDWTEEVGRARAAEALRRMDATRVTEAAQLRLYAQGLVRRDPRFAADLLAAADRHERTE